MWEVIGGANNGGIIVRANRDLASPSAPVRLSTGSRVKEIDLIGDRLHYRLLTGTGPDEGWISIAMQGKQLARKLIERGSDQDREDQSSTSLAKVEWNPYSILGIQPTATDAQIRSAFRKLSLKEHPDHNPKPDAADSFRTLTAAKDFLLNPLKRLTYNIKHGHRAQQHYIQWWSDWDQILEEIDPSQDCEDADDDVEGTGLQRIPLTIADSRTDVLIFGATGFVGTLICSMFQKHMFGRTWAIAGRDERKLGLLETKFGKGPLYRGKLHLEAASDVECIARTARIVIDVSGPKFIMGTRVIDACIRAGTHYIDNTCWPGDVLAMKPAFDELDSKAVAAKVSVTVFCGLGLTLYDFGTLACVQYLRQQFGLPTRFVNAYEILDRTFITGAAYLASRGQDDFDKELRKQGFFFLGGIPSNGLQTEDDEDDLEPIIDKYSGNWASLAEIDPMVVVRCSYGLLRKREPYGENFRFKVFHLFPDKAAANISNFRTGNKFLRRGYDKHIAMKKLPAAGQGPGERLRKECVSTRIFVAEADEEKEKKQTVHCILTSGPGGHGDHQEGSAIVVMEAANCVLDALDGGAMLPHGLGTPTYNLALLGFRERLAARGYHFEMREGVPTRQLFQNALSSNGVLMA